MVACYRAVTNKVMPEKNYHRIRSSVISQTPFFLLCGLVMLLMGTTSSSHAEDSADNIARQLKATHLLKIAHYVEWPDKAFQDPTSPIVIGVIGEAPLAEELEKISPAHEIGQRETVIRRLTTDDTSAKLHILYIGKRAGANAKAWLNIVEAQPMLSVCDASHELASTCAIKFLMDSNRLRFDISLPVAERSGIKITAPLLTVARQVDE